MAFLGGAECSTAGNPLSQFTKHVQDDRTLQRDRLVNQGPNSAGQSFRSLQANAQRQDETLKGFLQQAPTLPEMPMMVEANPGGHLHVNGPLHLPVRAESASPTWSDDFRNAHQEGAAFGRLSAAESTISPAEFARFGHAAQPSTASRTNLMPATGLQTPQQRAWLAPGLANASFAYSGFAQPMYQSQMYTPAFTQAPTQEGKGKGKAPIVELDDTRWEEQFAQIELEDGQVAVADQDAAIEAELDRLDERVMESETGYGDLESIWRGIQAEKEELGDFADFDEPYGLDWGSRLSDHPITEPYLFEEENLFKAHANPFEEGVRIMDEGGNLSLAALAFEAAVQKNAEHVDAWVYLGTAQAQNEKETAAIRALEHAIKLDPNNSAALMGLAVSYTNEGYDSTAYRTLERWLSVKYPQIIPPEQLSSAAEMGFTDRQQLRDKVTDYFIRAAQLSPGGEQMDPDVQVGLGVLFYGAEDYDKAVDCFTSALASSELGTSNQRSQIHLLWNRLGATLANSGRSEDAISAYEKALALRPNFVRARYNLGVSCINIGCQEAAAGHLLAALNMHKDVEKGGLDKAREILGGGAASDETIQTFLVQNQATTLHETLRRVFTQMGRPDLAQRVNADLDPESMRSEFDF
jgi:peroxin-5